MATTTNDALATGADGHDRCFWAVGAPEYLGYHDDEWGRPVESDDGFFERLCLEAFQSGLSWLTILRKRPAFRAAFADFHLAAVAAFGPDDAERLMNDAGIVRNRRKIEAALHNAGRCLEVVDEFGSLAALLWRFRPAAGAAAHPLARRLAGGDPRIDRHGRPSCANAAFALSVPRRPTPPCRPPAWSTTTPRAASCASRSSASSAPPPRDW